MLKNEIKIKDRPKALISKYAFKDLFEKPSQSLSNKESPFIRSMKRRQVLRHKMSRQTDEQKITV